MALNKLVPFRRKQRGAASYHGDSFIDALSRRTNEMFEDFFGDWGLEPFANIQRGLNFSPRVNVSEDDSKVTVEAELPGLGREDINLELNSDRLIISGEKKHEHEQKDNKKGYYRMERSYGSFSRVIDLPAEVDQENVKAGFKNGVLTVELPKTEAERTGAKKIKIEEH